MPEGKEKKHSSPGRHDRIATHINKKVNETSAGKNAICAKCGRPFEQVWIEKQRRYTGFDTCENCRVSNLGHHTARIPYTPHINQVPIHASMARFKLLAAGARFGKDRCFVNEFIKKFVDMLSEDRGPEMIPSVHGWIIAPTFPLARQIWREVKSFFPREWIVSIWESDKMISTVNDGVIEVRSADDANMLVGVGIDIVLITEAARIKDFEEVWANIETRLLSPGRGPNGTGGLALIDSTPRGRTWFYTMYRWGQKDDPEYDPLWESWHYTSWDNPYLTGKDKSVIESMKKRYPDRIYRQEILAEFLAEGNSVFPYPEDCAVFDGDGEPEPGEQYVIGWDPARSIDFSGVCIRNTRGQAVKIEQWNGIPWTAQLDKIQFLANYYNGALVVLDRTGLGETLPEAAAQRGIAVEPVYFTNLEKEKMVNNLALLVEQKLISYPNHTALINEMKDYSYTMTKTGRIVYGASSQNRHDDLVTCLMLAFKDFVTPSEVLPWAGLLMGLKKQPMFPGVVHAS